MSANRLEDLILQFLCIRRACTVRELAVAYGIPGSSAARVMGSLCRKGLVRRVEDDAAAETQNKETDLRGRRQHVYRLCLPGKIAALYFDGSRVFGAIVSEQGDILSLSKVSVREIGGLASAVSIAKDLLEELMRTSGIEKSGLSGVSLSLNAVRSEGRTVNSSVVPWAGESLEEAFSEALGLPVRVVVLPHLVAEFRNLTGAMPKSMVRFRVGDGVSAHAMIHSQPHEGGAALAGELGHVVVEPNGPLCACGQRGCLETLCSGPAILSGALSELGAGVVTKLDRKTLESGSTAEGIDEIRRAWESGDTYTVSLMEVVLDRLAWGLGLVMNLLDPEVVVMSGYVLEGAKGWQDEIVRRSKRWTMNAANRRTGFMEGSATLEEELQVLGLLFFYGKRVRRSSRKKKTRKTVRQVLLDVPRKRRGASVSEEKKRIDTTRAMFREALEGYIPDERG